MKLYIDGIEDNSVSYSAAIAPSAGGKLMMGGDDDGSELNQFLNGKMDEIRIYDRALSESEIEQLAGIEEKPGEFSLTVSKTGNGKGFIRGQVKNEERTLYCDSSCQQASYTYQAGDQIILNARSPAGFIFKQWGGDCTGTDTRFTLTMDGAKNCTAQFEPDPSNSALLTVNTNGTGAGIVSTTDNEINCGDDCSAYYPAI